MNRDLAFYSVGMQESSSQADLAPTQHTDKEAGPQPQLLPRSTSTPDHKVRSASLLRLLLIHTRQVDTVSLAACLRCGKPSHHKGPQWTNRTQRLKP